MTHYSLSDPLLPDILQLHGTWRSGRDAVICGSERLDWGTFNGRLNQVANASLLAGLKQGDRAIVLMKNGTEMLDVLFGLMKAGVTSVPVNLSVSNEAIAGMIKDADAKAVFCTADQAQRIDDHAELSVAAAELLKISTGDVNGWENYADWRAGAKKTKPDIRIEPDTPLNIIYSSGTTGVPKGIVHTQRGRRDWAGDLAIALRYHGAARTLITIGMYSNISWVSMLCTALAGGTLVIETGFDADRFWSVAEEERITHSSMVPLQLDKILAADPGAAHTTQVQAIMSAGSPLYPDLKKQLLARFGPTIIELYGLTEGVITTLDPEVAGDRLASAGQPLLGTDIKIVGDDDVELSQGKPGEIVATGRIVMPGYWNRPEATRDASWIAPDGSVWLRTGDIGRVDEEGYLYIVDRKKDMILSGGQNIYPQDIEARLVTHAAISEAAVIGAHSEKWGETPIGLVVLSAAAEPDALRAWCNEGLGKQQRLAEVLIIDELPRNPNGKILKRELRQQFKDRTYA